MLNILVNQLKKLVKKTTSIKFSLFISFLIEKLLERDRFFDAESAKQLGLIDKVLEHPIRDMQIEDEKQLKTNN
jgi:ATP-dependent protease ClpP protease subunit